MANQKLHYLSPFTSGPSSGTRSQQARAARRPTNLRTIPERDEESEEGPSRQRPVSSPPRLRRSRRLAPIFESSDESEDEEGVPRSMPSQLHSQPRPYFRTAPIVHSDDEEQVDLDEQLAVAGGVRAEPDVSKDAMDVDSVLDFVLQAVSSAARLTQEEDVAMPGPNIAPPTASELESSTSRQPIPIATAPTRHNLLDTGSQPGPSTSAPPVVPSRRYQSSQDSLVPSAAVMSTRSRNAFPFSTPEDYISPASPPLPVSSPPRVPCSRKKVSLQWPITIHSLIVICRLFLSILLYHLGGVSYLTAYYCPLVRCYPNTPLL